MSWSCVIIFLGFKSLSHGLIGGLTSLAQQTYEGATQRGFEVTLPLFTSC